MKKQVKDFISQYDTETEDMLFLVEKGCFGATIKEKYCLPCVRFIASYSPKTGELSQEPGYLDWIVKDNHLRSGWGHHFRSLGVYRIRVSRFLSADSSEESPLLAARGGNRFRIVRILRRSVKCSLFDKVREHYLTPVTIESPVYGSFTLDRSNDIFKSEISFGASEIALELTTDVPYGETADKALEALHRLYSDLPAVDERLKKYAAEIDTEHANDWNADEEPEKQHEITAEEFAKRMTLCMVSIENDGSASFWYDDDDMFFGHVIVIEVDSSGTPSEPKLMG